MTDMVIVKDANGNHVPVLCTELQKHVGTIFGMSPDVMVELRTAYHALNGKEPMTVESVREVFGEPA